MNAYSEGLNYVPLLAQQSTPPSSSRTRLSNGSRLTSRSSTMSLHKSAIVCYNGNYEGDTSMFGGQHSTRDKMHRSEEQLQQQYQQYPFQLQQQQQLSHNAETQSQHSRMDLIETDSDTEYKRELDTYEPPRHRPTSTSWLAESCLLRLCNAYTSQCLTPERLDQIATFTEQLTDSYYYRKFCELMRLASTLLVWLLRLALVSFVRFCNWSYGLWKSRSMLRNTARRLLWWMTLAKCGDVSFFALILLTSPLLFIVALFGFALSAYCVLKEWLSRSGYFLRYRVF